MTANFELSVQERLVPHLNCFGCGHANAEGLKLRSFAQTNGSVRAELMPWPQHDNGLGYLNGGIISTLLDCHSAAAVMLESERRGLPVDGSLQYVTAGLDVRFRRPAPLHEAVELIATVTEADDDQMLVAAELWWQDKVRATGEATWRRWRPRTS